MSDKEDNIIPLKSPQGGNSDVNVQVLLEKINGLDKKIEDLQKKKRSTFTPPTENELAEHIKEKDYHFCAEDFIAFYESKGWMVGKNKMKDWKSACRTWEKTWKENHPQQKQDMISQTNGSKHYPEGYWQ